MERPNGQSIPCPLSSTPTNEAQAHARPLATAPSNQGKAGPMVGGEIPSRPGTAEPTTSPRARVHETVPASPALGRIAREVAAARADRAAGMTDARAAAEATADRIMGEALAAPMVQAFQEMREALRASDELIRLLWTFMKTGENEQQIRLIIARLNANLDALAKAKAVIAMLAPRRNGSDTTLCGPSSVVKAGESTAADQPGTNASACSVELMGAARPTLPTAGPSRDRCPECGGKTVLLLDPSEDTAHEPNDQRSCCETGCDWSGPEDEAISAESAMGMRNGPDAADQARRTAAATAYAPSADTLGVGIDVTNAAREVARG